ncbi:transposase [Streptomyces sp. NPDC050617]|uniref:transposase n=1 Tax=Streptomyces sp. NPDC050617 TaxID=3154628 RepID=UPI003447F9A0
MITVREGKHSTPLRERAVRMVSDVRERTGRSTGAVAAVADRLGLDPHVLSSWVAQAGTGTSAPSANGDEVAVLNSRIDALQRENDILKAASLFFVRELDPPLRR